ncbi:TPA: hypothetical protein DEP34_03615 [Candidatus Uhrbacteria bacterium]|nr:hypothetical protein [Candidatus Uhrbacteria bacterium]
MGVSPPCPLSAFLCPAKKSGRKETGRPPALARPPLSPLALAAERRLPPVADRKKWSALEASLEPSSPQQA